jgi:hypothetical protein
MLQEKRADRLVFFGRRILAVSNICKIGCRGGATVTKQDPAKIVVFLDLTVPPPLLARADEVIE